VAQIDPLSGAEPAPAQMVTTDETQTAEGAASPNVLDRLYRPQALDVPVLVSRDGPIAAIDPRGSAARPALDGVVAEAETDPATGDVVQVVADARPGVEVLAVRPAWVRVSAADGTVLFEKTMDAGERYAVPDLEEAASLRTGNSGSVYFLVNGVTHGPAAPGASVVKDIKLAPDAVTGKFALADPAADEALSKVLTADASGTVESALE
jgi:hypothetical protein